MYGPGIGYETVSAKYNDKRLELKVEASFPAFSLQFSVFSLRFIVSDVSALIRVLTQLLEKCARM